jgi:hypothetical protein
VSARRPPVELRELESLRAELERQALRRLEGGPLTPEETEAIDELTLDLGPLGRLL